MDEFRKNILPPSHPFDSRQKVGRPNGFMCQAVNMFYSAVKIVPLIQALKVSQVDTDTLRIHFFKFKGQL